MLAHAPPNFCNSARIACATVSLQHISSSVTIKRYFSPHPFDHFAIITSDKQEYWYEILNSKLTCHHLHLERSSQSAGAACVPLWLLSASGSSDYFHYCGCWQAEEVVTVSFPQLHYESILHKKQLMEKLYIVLFFANCKSATASCHYYRF